MIRIKWLKILDVKIVRSANILSNLIIVTKSDMRND